VGDLLASILIRAALSRSASQSSTRVSFSFGAANKDRAAAGSQEGNIRDSQVVHCRVPKQEVRRHRLPSASSSHSLTVGGSSSGFGTSGQTMISTVLRPARFASSVALAAALEAGEPSRKSPGLTPESVAPGGLSSCLFATGCRLRPPATLSRLAGRHRDLGRADRL
jgi:hypothetical protein